MRRCGISTASPAPTAQRRHISFLYSGYYKASIRPSQYAQPRFAVQGARASYRSVLSAASVARKTPAKPTAKAPEATASAAPEGDAVEWSVAEISEADVMAAGSGASAAVQATPDVTGRAYVPMGDVVQMELKGDYLVEGGLHDAALAHYGVCCRAYSAAYPQGHNQVAKIFTKLARAFRLTGRPASAAANAERALSALDQNETPSVEHICEALLELGLAKEAAGDAEAGALYEDCATAMTAYHDIGSSHRGLRLLPTVAKRFNLNQEGKFEYWSPFDFDRTFAIADQALDHAEKFYGAAEDHVSVLRVLETRAHALDRKFFNMRTFAGRMRTHRGRNQRKAQAISSAPTATELLQFSPTIHQPYRDYAMERTAPLGREDEVRLGANAKVLDDGDPLRHVMQVQREEQRHRTIAQQMQQAKWER
jgi:hypothetical protein